jgi:hypothetical protein
MKKLLTLLALALTSTAYAGGVEFEYGHEDGRYAPNSSVSVPSNYFVMTPHTDVGAYEIGLKFEQARDNTSNASLENKLELQVQRDVVEFGQFKTAMQVGIGEDFNQNGPNATTPDFSYYQVSIKPSYQLTDKLTFETSYRYRNAFGSGHYFESNTVKAGFAYEIDQHYEIGVRVGQKFGADEQAHFIEAGVNYNF